MTKNFDGKKLQFVTNFRLWKNLGTYRSTNKGNLKERQRG